MADSRHPEKAKNKINPIPKKPDWIRVKAPTSKFFKETNKLLKDKKIVTVCEEAACRNIAECWQKKYATFMILGDICTRACAFCNIKTGKPQFIDHGEAIRIAESVKQLNLEHDRPHRQSPNDPEDLQVQRPIAPYALVRARQLAVARIHIRTRRLDVVIETLDDLGLLRY